MRQVPLLIFDPAAAPPRAAWGPMTDLRAAFDLRSGALTNKQRIERALQRSVSALWIADHTLAPLAVQSHGELINHKLDHDELLIVDGRWSGCRAAEQVRALERDEALFQPDGHLVAARLAATDAMVHLQTGRTLPAQVKRHVGPSRLLMQHPWHVLDELSDNLQDDLAAIDLPRIEAASRGGIGFGDHPLLVAEDVVIQPGAVFNTERGSIAIESGATIGALAVLEGPCYIGSNSIVACHAHIRSDTVVGPVCKVGGEIGHSILHSHANKAHQGYLGDSLVGQWVNLGADTNVSNLKNTYGPVRVQLEADGDALDTGRTFHGPIIGDMVRTGIGTRLMTGACIGTGVMIAHSALTPRLIPSFTFLTDAGPQPCDMARFLQSLRRMMARRNVEPSEALEARLHHLASLHNA